MCDALSVIDLSWDMRVFRDPRLSNNESEPNFGYTGFC